MTKYITSTPWFNCRHCNKQGCYVMVFENDQPIINVSCHACGEANAALVSRNADGKYVANVLKETK